MIHFKFINRVTGKPAGDYHMPSGMPMATVDAYCGQYGYDAEIVSVTPVIDHLS